MTKNSKQLLGKEMTSEQVKTMHQPSLKTSQKGCRHLKTKLQLGSGRSCTKFWDNKGKRIDVVPDDWFDTTFKANLCVRHLYVMPKEVGFVIEVRDLRCKTLEVANPFGDETEQEE